MSVADLVEKVGLFISARGLTKMDTFSNTDPFAVLYIKDIKTGHFVKAGRTATVMDTQSPDWATQFILDYFFESVQEIAIKVFDKDGNSPEDRESAHELCGEVRFNLSTLMCSKSQSLTLPLKGGRSGGNVVVRAEGVSNCRDILHMNVACSKLANKDGFFGKSDPFLRFLRVYEDGTWGLVHETSPIDNNLSPVFNCLHLPMVSICNGDLDRPVKIEVWDHESSGRHQFMGHVETSVRGMLSGAGPMNVIEPAVKAKDKNYKNSGTLACQNVVIEPRPSFADFIMGGCEVSLVVGIDFTGSNGAVTDPSSLHYIHPTGAVPNQYQQAINAVGRVLEDYDSDKMYPVYGFGAKVRMPNGSFSPVQHCFPVYGGGLEVKGVDGILKAYMDSLANVALSGPTLFTPLIDAAAEFARRNNCTQAQQKYTVLLIMTDGEITDMENTIGAICRASSAPISIIIIGVGSADFSSMRQLDGDNGPLRSGGITAERDIVQFVSFRDFAAKGTAVLASEVLAEVPRQCLEYMSKRKIVPNPPKGGLSGAGF